MFSVASEAFFIFAFKSLRMLSYVSVSVPSCNQTQNSQWRMNIHTQMCTKRKRRKACFHFLSSPSRTSFGAFSLLFVGDYKRQIFLRCCKACIIEAPPQLALECSLHHTIQLLMYRKKLKLPLTNFHTKCTAVPCGVR